MGCGSAAHRTLEETFERIYTIEPTANVTVINGDGAVFIHGSNTNEMRGKPSSEHTLASD